MFFFLSKSEKIKIKISKLNDLLSGRLIRDDKDSINMKTLFQGISMQPNQVTATRMMLIKLGFAFFMEEAERYLVKLPDKSLEPKLSLILRCLVIIQSNTNRIIRLK